MHKLSEKEIARLVLYKDHNIIILNKPGGIAVHKGPKGGITVEDWFQFLRFGNKENPALAHRLDRSTSGCLILGRHKKALKKLGQLFETKKIKKKYLAIVEGKMQKKEGAIDAPLKKKSDLKKGWWMETVESGQVAITNYKVLKEGKNRSFVEFTPLTGRTHQIRVHAKYVGTPIVGDPIYGNAAREDNLMLHAASIEIPYHIAEPAIKVEVEAPAYFTEELLVINE